jgi:hypothetical protein
MSTPTTDIAAWTTAVRDRAERVMSAMDCQTDLFGLFIDEMRGMREAVDRLSTSAASSSRAAASTVADEEEDEEVDEEENEGGEGDDNDDEDEEGGEEGRSGSGGVEWDAAPEASASVQVADRPHVPQVAERLRIPCPQWRVWKDKGKGKM